MVDLSVGSFESSFCLANLFGLMEVDSELLNENEAYTEETIYSEGAMLEIEPDPGEGDVIIAEIDPDPNPDHEGDGGELEFDPDPGDFEGAEVNRALQPIKTSDLNSNSGISISNTSNWEIANSIGIENGNVESYPELNFNLISLFGMNEINAVDQESLKECIDFRLDVNGVGDLKVGNCASKNLELMNVNLNKDVDKMSGVQESIKCVVNVNANKSSNENGGKVYIGSIVRFYTGKIATDEYLKSNITLANVSLALDSVLVSYLQLYMGTIQERFNLVNVSSSTVDYPKFCELRGILTNHPCPWEGHCLDSNKLKKKVNRASEEFQLSFDWKNKVIFVSNPFGFRLLVMDRKSNGVVDPYIKTGALELIETTNEGESCLGDVLVIAKVGVQSFCSLTYDEYVASTFVRTQASKENIVVAEVVLARDIMKEMKPDNDPSQRRHEFYFEHSACVKQVDWIDHREQVVGTKAVGLRQIVLARVIIGINFNHSLKNLDNGNIWGRMRKGNGTEIPNPSHHYAVDEELLSVKLFSIRGQLKCKAIHFANIVTIANTIDEYPLALASEMAANKTYLSSCLAACLPAAF